jgi:predicted transcriptional regulator
MLVERGLIAKEEEEGSNVYKTTERGIQFLELYKNSLRDLFLILARTMVTV